jgi:hypothetical protein
MRVGAGTGAAVTLETMRFYVSIGRDGAVCNRKGISQGKWVIVNFISAFLRPKLRTANT